MFGVRLASQLLHSGFTVPPQSFLRKHLLVRLVFVGFVALFKSVQSSSAFVWQGVGSPSSGRGFGRGLHPYHQLGAACSLLWRSFGFSGGSSFSGLLRLLRSSGPS